MRNNFNTENNNESFINYDDKSYERSSMDIEDTPISSTLNGEYTQIETFDNVKERYPHINDNESLINYEDKSDERSPMHIEATPPSSSLDRELPHTETFYYVKERYSHIKETANTPVDQNINTKMNISGMDNGSVTKQLFNVDKEIPIPLLFSENDINQRIKKMNLSEEMKDRILLSENSEDDTIKKIKYQLELDSKKRIKGTKEESSIRIDNIIDKIKNMTNSSLLTSTNSIIETVYKGNIEQKNKIVNSLKSSKIELKNNTIEIKMTEYKIRGERKSMDDILKHFLDINLNQYFSNGISPKFDQSKVPKNYNEIVIKTLLNDENNKELFDFLFNRFTVEDSLDIFIYKKELSDIKGYNALKHNQIKDNIVRIENYLDKILKKNGKIYLHCFLLLIFNLKRYLLLREKRNRKSNKDN